ncbi:MAG: FG-GAP repeat protein, partial [Myxococcota bacterium]
ITDDHVVTDYFGPVWIYRRQPSGLWTYFDALYPPPGTVRTKGFGAAVALTADALLVGAPRALGPRGQSAAGALFAFARHPATGEIADAGVVLDPPVLVTDEGYGANLAVAGDRLVVGSDSFLSGSAYIFNRDPASGAWSLDTELKAFDGATQGWFGREVAIGDDWVVVGARGRTEHGLDGAGATFVYRRDADSERWLRHSKLTAGPDAAAEGAFGHSIAISGDYMIVGAPGEDPLVGLSSQGAAYIYRLDSAEQWQRQARATAFDRDGHRSGRFADQLVVLGRELIVADPSRDVDSDGGAGQIYVFGSEGLAWAVGHAPTAPQYVSTSAYNASGEPISIIRVATGHYAVDIGWLMDGLRATAYTSRWGLGASGDCQLGEPWFAGVVYVRCFDSSGQPADLQFATTLYGIREFPDDGGTGRQEFFLRADRPTEPEYTPDPDYQASPDGAEARIRRLSAGVYNVRMPIIAGTNAGHVVVAAYGTTARHCKTNTWTPDGNDIRAFVRCFNADGDDADSRFTLHYTDENVPTGVGAYLWANEPLSAFYTPIASHQWSSGGESATVERTEIGRYRVHLPGLALIGGMVQASGYGNTDHRCHAALWYPDLTLSGKLVTVQCQDASGRPADSECLLRFIGDPTTF